MAHREEVALDGITLDAMQLNHTAQQIDDAVRKILSGEIGDDYNAAVEAGYTGTRDEFYAALASLQNAPFLPRSGGIVAGPFDVTSPGGGTQYIHIDDGANNPGKTKGLFEIGHSVDFKETIRAAKAISSNNLQTTEGADIGGGLRVGKGATITGGLEVVPSGGSAATEINVAGKVTCRGVIPNSDNAPLGDSGGRFNTLYTRKVDASEWISSPKLKADKLQKRNGKPWVFPRPSTIVIGTSSAGWTQGDCDYLCDGENDEVEINAAISALTERTIQGAVSSGEILLLNGVYKLSGNITVNKQGVTIRGVGPSTILVRNDFYEAFRIISDFCSVRDLAILTNGAGIQTQGNFGLFSGLTMYLDYFEDEGSGIIFTSPGSSDVSQPKFNKISDCDLLGGTSVTLRGSYNIVTGNRIEYIVIDSSSQRNLLVGNIIISAPSTIDGAKQIVVGNMFDSKPNAGSSTNIVELNIPK